MNIELKDLKDWVLLIVLVAGWISSISILWTRLVGKVNGMGGRVKKVEESCSQTGGRMERMERELAEYRHDAQDAVGRMSRVEKGVEELNDNVREGNIGIGSQLHNLERLIQEKDQKTSNRLVRMETVAQIEKKLGPIPIE